MRDHETLKKKINAARNEILNNEKNEQNIPYKAKGPQNKPVESLQKSGGQNVQIGYGTFFSALEDAVEYKKAENLKSREKEILINEDGKEGEKKKVKKGEVDEIDDQLLKTIDNNFIQGCENLESAPDKDCDIKVDEKLKDIFDKMSADRGMTDSTEYKRMYDAFQNCKDHLNDKAKLESLKMAVDNYVYIRSKGGKKTKRNQFKKDGYKRYRRALALQKFANNQLSFVNFKNSVKNFDSANKDKPLEATKNNFKTVDLIIANQKSGDSTEYKKLVQTLIQYMPKPDILGVKKLYDVSPAGLIKIKAAADNYIALKTKGGKKKINKFGPKGKIRLEQVITLQSQLEKILLDINLTESYTRQVNQTKDQKKLEQHKLNNIKAVDKEFEFVKNTFSTFLTNEELAPTNVVQNLPKFQQIANDYQKAVSFLETYESLSTYAYDMFKIFNVSQELQDYKNIIKYIEMFSNESVESVSKNEQIQKSYKKIRLSVDIKKDSREFNAAQTIRKMHVTRQINFARVKYVLNAYNKDKSSLPPEAFGTSFDSDWGRFAKVMHQWELNKEFKAEDLEKNEDYKFVKELFGGQDVKNLLDEKAQKYSAKQIKRNWTNDEYIYENLGTILEQQAEYLNLQNIADARKLKRIKEVGPTNKIGTYYGNWLKYFLELNAAIDYDNALLIRGEKSEQVKIAMEESMKEWGSIMNTAHSEIENEQKQ